MTREEWRTRAINHGTELRKVKEQLRIATEALKCYQQKMWNYEDEYNYYPCKTGGWIHAEKALKKIKELEDKYNEPGNHN
jgi:hypothetical protein